MVDMHHFHRARDNPADLAALPREWFHFAQICDAPAEIPTERDEMIHILREARLYVGEGGIDVAGILGTSRTAPIRSSCRTSTGCTRWAMRSTRSAASNPPRRTWRRTHGPDARRFLGAAPPHDRRPGRRPGWGRRRPRPGRRPSPFAGPVVGVFIEEKVMDFKIDRRSVLKAGAALAASQVIPAWAQDKPQLRLSAVFSDKDIRADMIRMSPKDVEADFKVEPYFTAAPCSSRAPSSSPCSATTSRWATSRRRTSPSRFRPGRSLTSAYLFRDAEPPARSSSPATSARR